MNTQEYEKLLAQNEQDEINFSSFGVTCILGTIAGAWVVIIDINGKLSFFDVRQKIIVVLLLCVSYLLNRGLRMWLNILHNRKILADEQTSKSAKGVHPDAGHEVTFVGKLSYYLYFIEVFLLFSAPILFCFACAGYLKIPVLN